jgi:UDP-N-acetylglucosamine 2-epimerase (non-hydrolysing)
MVLVQGDTTTTFVGGLSAFYRQIPVGHVEAGLRTNDRANPFPEEINRRLTSCVSNLHFAPTATAKRALLKENVDKNSVFVTGNTVIDALNIAVKQNYQFTRGQVSELISHKRKMVLITLHRRENWGEPLGNAARAIRDLAFNHPDIDFIFPIHLNPIVREAISPHMKGIKNIYLIEPLDYPDFVNLMSRCHLIITDSGGVQEEGPHFGIPILVLRKVTERPEAVKYGTVKLVGLETDTIYRTAEKLLRNKTAYEKMASATNPYGDGLASVRIINIIKKYFNLPYDPIEEFNAGI